jgi:hypothetical protein
MKKLLIIALLVLPVTASALDMPRGCYVDFERPLSCAPIDQREGISWKTYRITSEGVDEYGPVMQYVLEKCDSTQRADLKKIKALNRQIRKLKGGK